MVWNCRCVNELRKAEYDNYSKLVNDNLYDQKKMWRALKEIWEETVKAK